MIRCSHHDCHFTFRNNRGLRRHLAAHTERFFLDSSDDESAPDMNMDVDSDGSFDRQNFQADSVAFSPAASDDVSQTEAEPVRYDGVTYGPTRKQN